MTGAQGPEGSGLPKPWWETDDDRANEWFLEHSDPCPAGGPEFTELFQPLLPACRVVSLARRELIPVRNGLTGVSVGGERAPAATSRRRLYSHAPSALSRGVFPPGLWSRPLASWKAMTSARFRRPDFEGLVTGSTFADRCWASSPASARFAMELLPARQSWPQKGPGGTSPPIQPAVLAAVRVSLAPGVSCRRGGTAHFGDAQPQERDDQDQDVDGQARQHRHEHEVEASHEV